VLVILRSVVFNVLFYLNLSVQLVAALPTLVMPRRAIIEVARFWARSNLWLLRIVCGTRVEFRGLEIIPEGPLLVASKHQSLWETFALITVFHDPAYIMKRELMWIPFFGWYIAKMRMIPVHRGSRSKALKKAVAATKAELERNSRQLIIYPEGTRRAPGDEPNYKYGIVELYAQLGVPVVPVAHVAGLYWPRRKFLRFPGAIKARYLPPIPPGLDKEEFMQRLIRETEAACDQYLIEAATGPNPPALPPTAVKRLQELGIAVKG
jgi:1-acyl-sn-glycerol-3-phosphate acyltransferase